MKNQLFPRKKWFWAENQLFPRKNQKNQKKHLLGNYAAKLQKGWFFWFSLGKVGFGLGGYSAAVDFVLTSNLNELTDMSC